MEQLRHVTRIVFRLIVVWVVDILSLLIADAVYFGINITAPDAGRLVVAAAAALMIGIINFLIRPAILLLALPLGFFVVFAAGFFVNAVVLLIAAALLPGFEVKGLLDALVGGIILSAVNTVITSVITIDDEDSFYQGVVERIAARQPFQGAGTQERGLVILEIDGLSYLHIQKAIEGGYMPTVARMLKEEGYALSHVDCGLPSQTSACQAGIMFGDNYDIPSFRWLDKDQNKLYVSGKDAPELNARYAKGQGLMRGGTSINNMLDGDAQKSLLTLANIRGGTPEEQKRRAEDIYLLMLNPYFFMRTIALFIGDIFVELWQGWQQRRKDVQPRLDRLHKFYPVLRATTTVFMRDVQAYLAILDIVRGSPSIYLTYPGYDEVAHHSGPWTTDAFRTLRQIDRVIARLLDIIARKAPRPYELLILSDHGQSFGATFKQRYSMDLKEFIERNLPSGTTVAQAMGGDNGMIAMESMSGELDNLQRQQVTGRTGKAVVGGTQKLLGQTMERQESAAQVEPAKVTVCGSGNIAQVYFDLQPRKLALDELDAAYPGMVDALVQHEGVGFVVIYQDGASGDSDRFVPVVLGKNGQRNLHTGQVTGQDPLAPYGEVELRAKQVRRVADFPHAGDLIVNSTVYPDGTVAAMEELIGNHGGLGGEQTDAFLLHPSDMTVPPTSNSADLFSVLNARRGLVGPPSTAAVKTVVDKEISAWSPATLATGLIRFSVWIGRALRAVTLDRSAFSEVVQDVTMTGPAVLIGALSSMAISLFERNGFDLFDMAARFLMWLVGVLAVLAAGRVLGSRARYTRVLRGQGFARAAYLLELLAVIPPLANVGHLLAVVVGFLTTWIGAVEAHELKGWRTIIFPLAMLLVVFLAMFVFSVLFQGAAFTLVTLAGQLGLAP